MDDLQCLLNGSFSEVLNVSLTITICVLPKSKLLNMDQLLTHFCVFVATAMRNIIIRILHITLNIKPYVY